MTVIETNTPLAELSPGQSQLDASTGIPSAEGDDLDRSKFFTSICTRATDELRQALKIDEQTYRIIAGYGYSYPRDYYLYGLLDEIEKAGVALIQYEGFLSGEKADPADRIGRNVLTSALDEQALWIRKLTEILVEVLLFQQTNQDSHFRHYLLLKEFDAYRKLNSDFKEFFCVENRNISYTLGRLRAEIARLQSNASFLNQCWYIKPNKKGLRLESSDFMTRFKAVIKNCTPSQKIVLGLSYETAYSRPSRGVHVNIGGATYTIDPRSFERNIGQIGLLAAHVLLISKQLIKVRPKGLLGQLSRVFRTNTYPKELLRQATKPRIEKGDFVLAYGDLAEVVDLWTSPFGYRSFRIKYLSKPPLPGIDEDKFPARYVRLLVKRKEMAKQVESVIRKDVPDAKIGRKGLHQSLRKTVVELWQQGILQQMIQRRAPRTGSEPDAGA